MYEAGKPMYPVLEGAPPGMTDLTYACERPDGTVVITASSDAIVESDPGVYVATRVTPAKGSYLHLWHSTTESQGAAETFVVGIEAATEVGLYYASFDEFRAFHGFTEDQFPDELLLRPLRMAQFDVDTACGPSWDVFTDTGLQFRPGEWETRYPKSRLLLMQATCIQAYYRMVMGDDFMTRDQYESEGGPDYSSTGKLRKASPEAVTKLHQAGLVKLHGTALSRFQERANHNRGFWRNGVPTANG